MKQRKEEEEEEEEGTDLGGDAVGDVGLDAIAELHRV